MSKETTYDHDYNTIFKSFCNILKLLSQQGYNIDTEKDVSLTELQSRIETNTINFLVEKENGEKCYVIYHIIKQLRPAHIHEYTEDIFEFREILKPEDQLIIITKDKFNMTTKSGLSDTIVNVINELYRDFKFYINVFPRESLQFSVLEHCSVPKHEKMSKENEVALIKKYNINNKYKNMPTIPRFDAAAKSIGLRPGEICEITRPSKTTILSKYYRVCI